MISQSRHFYICQFWRQVCLSCCPSDHSKPRTRGSFPALCKKSHLSCAIFYCRMWPLWLQHVLPHYLINGTIFGEKKLLNKKCMVWFSRRLLYETFLIVRRTERDVITCVYRCSWKYGLFSSYFKQHELPH